MPPKENDRLTKDQVAILRNWIAAGARWETTSASKPDDKWSPSGRGIRIPTSGGRSADWENRTYEPEAVWAYQPIRRPEVPGGRGQNPIDAFLLAALKA